MTFDRHEAECARVEAEFNGVEHDYVVDPLMMVDQMMMALSDITDRLKAIEAKLDDK